LLYEELSYAMNHGDIGYTKTCIVAWIPIPKATAKHKYAMHILNFLIDIHFVYPPRPWYDCQQIVLIWRLILHGTRQAIHYHILVNPTSKEMS
ncbi:hypothetical protein BDR05DRAFT_882793, partial [Suillus weaverae]